VTDLIAPQQCCPSHKSWPELTQHLVESFPDVPLVDLVSIVNRTRQAEAAFGLPEAEHVQTAELIVRRQLMQLVGTDGPLPRPAGRRHE
jgi:hypothetical protein